MNDPNMRYFYVLSPYPTTTGTTLITWRPNPTPVVRQTRRRRFGHWLRKCARAISDGFATIHF